MGAAGCIAGTGRAGTGGIGRDIGGTPFVKTKLMSSPLH